MERTIQPIAWSEPDRHGGRTADTPQGRWSLREGPTSIKAKFHPNVPGLVTAVGSLSPEEKLVWRREWDAFNVHPGEAAMTEGYQRLSHCFGIGNDDALHSETILEAEMLIEAINEGDAVMPSAVEQLEAAGFAVKWPDKSGVSHIWARDVGNGSLQVALRDNADERSMWVTHHGKGSASWSNVLGARQRFMGSSGTMIHHSYPDQVRDPLRIGVAVAMRIMELRLERGGRFRTPLGDPLKR